jgi:glycosyltransferase involved in cell wall biosynthesis
MTVRVAVLTEDPEGPSARHRWTYPARHLAKEGIEIRLHAVQPRTVRAAAFAAAAAADVTVIHRKMFRFLDLLRLVRAVRGKNRRLIYDLDDAVMYRPSGRFRQWSFLRRVRFARTVRQCSVFLAGNEYLKSQAPVRVPCTVIPTPVDVSRYEPRDEWPERGRIIGWIGTESTARYLDVVAKPLAELAASRTDLVFRVIGPEPRDLPGIAIDHVPWTEESEAAAIRTLDVGILPLAYDRWSRGKCAFKALQYMAAGLPVVASPVGMNTEVVTEGVTGHHAAGDPAWVESIAGLLDDADRRRGFGAAGRARVEERYSIEAVSSLLAPILEGQAR